MAYKPNIDDARESPTLEIMQTVTHKGGAIITILKSLRYKHNRGQRWIQSP
ncbi:Rossmann-fold NAD(P)-binding domain-containing protein [Sunxiuqinia indica]|uniref:hypothetical protein n=1 Tax=Sunxiuqinia indica TaxID=2692584 RepID=UPI003743E2F5